MVYPIDRLDYRSEREVRDVATPEDLACIEVQLGRTPRDVQDRKSVV